MIIINMLPQSEKQLRYVKSLLFQVAFASVIAKIHYMILNFQATQEYL